MNLAELEHEEVVALLALLGLMARLDGQVSGDEMDFLTRVVSEIGREKFDHSAKEAAALPDTEAILHSARKVTRPAAREVLFEVLYDMAMREVIVEREVELLDFLTETWELPPRTGAS